MSGGDKSPLGTDFESLSIASQFDTLINVIPRAYREGILLPLPEAEEQVVTDALIASRLRTVRTRLRLLGYANKPEIPRNLRRAIRNFQREAGLYVDGWVGPQTWTALQELVSLGNSVNLAHWASGPEENLALRRAVGLRLSVLGLLAKPTRDKRKIAKGLREFVRIAGSLNLTEAPLTPSYTPDTLNTLFDLDLAVQCLARFEDDIADSLPEEDAAQACRYVAHLAKIELWLLGYSVDLDDRSDILQDGRFPVPPAGNTTYHRDPTYSFYTALRRFWIDAGQYSAKARQSAQRGITGEFFRVLLASTDGRSDLQLDATESERLYTETMEAAKHKKSLLGEIWSYIEDLGSRMWDGIRRAWLWFRNVIGRGKPYVRWARNLARLVYRYALQTFGQVRQLIAKVSESISFLTRFYADQKAPGSTDLFSVRCDRDFDFYLHVQSEANRQQLHALTQELLRQATYFGLGMRILAVLARHVIDIITALPSVAGWFVFVLSMVKSYKDLWLLLRKGLVLLEEDPRTVPA